MHDFGNSDWNKYEDFAVQFKKSSLHLGVFWGCMFEKWSCEMIWLFKVAEIIGINFDLQMEKCIWRTFVVLKLNLNCCYLMFTWIYLLLYWILPNNNCTELLGKQKLNTYLSSKPEMIFSQSVVIGDSK